MNESSLVKYQNHKIRKIIYHAYESVPFYRKIFKKLNISPSDIKTKQDLNKLPIVRKSQLKQEHEINLISREFIRKKLYNLRTGGSTGEPFSVYVTRKEMDWRLAVQMRANIYCGQRTNDHWVSLESVDDLIDLGWRRRFFGFFTKTSVPIVWNSERQLNMIEKLHPDVLDGLSSSLWLLARESQKKSLGITPRMVFGTGELITPSVIDNIETTFKAPYYDQISCTEVGRIAWQCTGKKRYHINTDSIIVQFINKEGEEVSPGERGEMVFTSLYNYAMPFIRYGIQDIGIPLESECKCGINLPSMKLIEGRNNSFLIFPGGHIISPWIFIETMKIFYLTKEIDRYSVVQKREDLIEIYVKISDRSVDESKIRNWILSNLTSELPKVEKIDLSKVTFEVKFVDYLPVTSRGKFSVISSYLDI